MFTCRSLLSTCNEVLDPGDSTIYLLDLPNEVGQSLDQMGSKTLDELVQEGWDQRDEIEPLKWVSDKAKNRLHIFVQQAVHRDYRYIIYV